ncbi:MAG: phosphatidate cytidylyltransferase [Novosphingobium sp.]
MAGGEKKKSDLGVRTASAVVMVAVAGTALWLGGWVWAAFVAAVALGVLWEWRGLVAGFQPSPMKRGLWNAGGLVYVGLAAFILAMLRMRDPDAFTAIIAIASVIATDIGAYFAGRTFGGPKIAPKISPSKTWSGLAGGMLGAGLTLFVAYHFYDEVPLGLAMMALPVGAVIAIVAQAGDFFESWMKRRAGVKDSGTIIPGHGGLFDRVDGLLAVCFVLGVLSLHSFVSPQ